MLWFAFILLSLSYWKQHVSEQERRAAVVICFHFTIFVVLETTQAHPWRRRDWLWFAFILLSLSYWKQLGKGRIIHWSGCDLLSFYYLCRTGNNWALYWRPCSSVVICFHFTIFVVLETTRMYSMVVRPCCDLLSFYYLCRTGNNMRSKSATKIQLWFAFILLSLSYWKQQGGGKKHEVISCDLLSFYYLCRTGNNRSKNCCVSFIVVICFHFTIFVVLETTEKLNKFFETGCDLLSFYYLCRTGNNR